MKKILTAAILMGLSGTGVMAEVEVNLSSLPPELQAKIKSASNTPNPINQYVTTTKNQVAGMQAEVNSLVADNPYLNGNTLIDNVINPTIQQTNNVLNNTTSWQPAESAAASVQGYTSIISSTYDYVLNNLTYPNACKANQAATIQGWVKLKLGSPNVYALYKNDDNHAKPLYEIADPEHLGQIGTGKEYTVSIAKNSLVNAQVGPDGNGNTVVVCMDLAATPVPPPPPTK
jgi:hypothetical protein